MNCLYFREALTIVNSVHQENISVEHHYDDFREKPQNSLSIFLSYFFYKLVLFPLTAKSKTLL